MLLQKAELTRFAFASMRDSDTNKDRNLPLLIRVGPTWSPFHGLGRIISGTAHSSGFADQVSQVPAIPGETAHDRDLLLGLDALTLQEASVFQP
jgi:hypothetical protein